MSERPLPAPERSGRICLHCVVVRAVAAEAALLQAHGVTLMVGELEPRWLPAPATAAYRALRRLLRGVATVPRGVAARLCVIDRLGTPHVEVAIMTRPPAGERGRVLSCRLPRHAEHALGRGFLEAWAPR